MNQYPAWAYAGKEFCRHCGMPEPAHDDGCQNEPDTAARRIRFAWSGNENDMSDRAEDNMFTDPREVA